jgi:hypothetical protein
MAKQQDVSLPRVTQSAEYGDLWSIDAVGAQFGFLQGEVLTIIEAALTGPQLQAVKDLVKKSFRDRQRHMAGAFEPRAMGITTRP